MHRSHPDSFLQRVMTSVAQGVSAQAASHGFPFIPEGFAGQVMMRAVNDLKALPNDKLRDLSLGNQGLVGTVMKSFETVYSQLSPVQQLALKQGRDPYRTDSGPDAAAELAAKGGHWVNGRWVLGADAGIGKWLGIAGPDSGANGNGSRAYAGIDPRVWHPESGIGGLTANNFGGTEFAKAGLSLNETQELASKFGFNKDQIVHAGQDAKSLGLNPKDLPTAKDFATVDRDDPLGRKQRNDAYAHYSKWMKDHKEELDKEQAAVDGAKTDEDRKTHTERLRKLLQQGQQQAGMPAVDDRLKDKPEAKAAHERIKHRIEHLNGVHADLRHEVGSDAARKEPAKVADNDTQQAVKKGMKAAPAALGAGLLAAAGPIDTPAQPKPKPTQSAALAKPSPFGHA